MDRQIQTSQTNNGMNRDSGEETDRVKLTVTGRMREPETKRKRL